MGSLALIKKLYHRYFSLNYVEIFREVFYGILPGDYFGNLGNGFP